MCVSVCVCEMDGKAERKHAFWERSSLLWTRLDNEGSGRTTRASVGITARAGLNSVERRAGHSGRGDQPVAIYGDTMHREWEGLVCCTGERHGQVWGAPLHSWFLAAHKQRFSSPTSPFFRDPKIHRSGPFTYEVSEPSVSPPSLNSRLY